MPKTYNEALQAIIKAYHGVGYATVGVTQAGIYNPAKTIFSFVVRKANVDHSSKNPAFRIRGNESQHENTVKYLANGGNILGMANVVEDDGKE